MKKLIAVFLLFLMMLPTAMAEESSPRILVAYLSRAGENYNVGVPQAGSASASYRHWCGLYRRPDMLRCLPFRFYAANPWPANLPVR